MTNLAMRMGCQHVNQWWLIAEGKRKSGTLSSSKLPLQSTSRWVVPRWWIWHWVTEDISKTVNWLRGIAPVREKTILWFLFRVKSAPLLHLRAVKQLEYCVLLAWSFCVADTLWVLWLKFNPYYSKGIIQNCLFFYIQWNDCSRCRC